MVVTREFKGKTPDHFTFESTSSEIAVITASGTGPNYAYHGPKQRWYISIFVFHLEHYMSMDHF